MEIKAIFLPNVHVTLINFFCLQIYPERGRYLGYVIRVREGWAQVWHKATH